MPRRLHALFIVLLVPGFIAALGVAPNITAQPAAGPAPQAVLPLGGPDVGAFDLSSNMTQIAFTASTDFQNTFQLYHVPLTGGAPPQISPPGSNTALIGIPADNAHAVYLNRGIAQNSSDLYLVPINGGDALKLNPTLTAPNLISEARLSPDRRYVIYNVAERFGGAVSEIDSVVLDTHAVHPLTPPLAEGQYVTPMGITPDNATLIFELINFNTLILYAASLAGGDPVQLDTMTAWGERHRVVITPDSLTVLNTHIQPSTQTYTVDRIPISGGAPQQLVPAFGADSNVELVGVSSDNRWAVVRVKLSTASAYAIYSVHLDGSGAPVKLVDGLSESNRVTSFAISDDGQRVVYWVLRQSDNAVLIYSVPIAGGSIVPLNPPPEAGGPVLEPGFAISPDSRRVILLSGHALYSVPIAGGAVPVQINAPLNNGGTIQSGSVRFSPDGRYVLYRGETNGDFRYDLIATPTDASGSPTVITPSSLYVAGYPYVDFDSHRATPDSRQVLFLAGTSANGARTLYAADLASTGGVVIQRLEHGSAVAGSASFTLAIKGANFVPGTQIEWNGSLRPITFVDNQNITLAVNAADLTNVTAIPIRVVTPGGGQSNVVFFYVTPSQQMVRAIIFLPFMRR
jgi:hypothetical protein